MSGARPDIPDRARPRLLANRSLAPQTRLLKSYGQLPLSFEANRGQTDPRVKFLSRGRGYTLFLTSTEAVLALRKPAATNPQRSTAGRDGADSFLKSAAVPAFPRLLRVQAAELN